MPLAPNNSRTVCSGEPNPDVSSFCDAVCNPELLFTYEGYARVFVSTNPNCQDGVTIDPRVHYHDPPEKKAEAVHSPKIIRTYDPANPGGRQQGD